MVLATIYVLTLSLAGTLLVGISYIPAETSLTVRRWFFALFATGCVAAIWCTFFLQYQLRPTVRIRGFPIPVAILELQNDRWVPFDSGLGVVIDLVAIPCLICLPLSITLIVRGIRRTRAESQRGFPITTDDVVSD